MNLYFNNEDESYTTLTKQQYYPFFEDFQEKATVCIIKTEELLDTSSLLSKDSINERLFSVLYYSHKLRYETRSIIKNNQFIEEQVTDNKSTQLIVFNPKHIACDYETFIFHAKSLIDIVIKFIYDNFGKPSTKMKKRSKSSFNCFKSYIELHHNVNIKSLFGDVTQLENDCNNILEYGTQKSLRNILTHQSSIFPLIGCYFSMFKENNKILILDADIYEKPLINTVIKITEALTYFVCKVLKTILSHDLHIYREDYKLNYKNMFTNFRDYIDESSNDKLQITVLTKDGFVLNEVKINKNKLLTNAIII